MTFEILDLESHKYEIVDFFNWCCAPDLNNIFFTEINYIHKNKLSITLKYHYFEVVTFEILDLEGHKYEEVDYFSW